MRYTCVLFFLLSLGVATSSAGPAVQATKQRYFRDPKALGSLGQNGNISVVNAASFLPGISPGALATAFGTNLTDVNGVVVADTNPFPTKLANVSVAVNGILAPIFSVAFVNGQDQISFQVPWQTDVGSAAAFVEVFDFDERVGSERVDSFTEDPGIFGYQKYGNVYAVAVHASDFALVSPNDPAERGEVLVLYATGLGPVDQVIPDGFGAPSNPPARTLDPFTVVLAGEDVPVLFSGLAPGFVGLYQLNIRLPDDLPVGDLRLQILSDFANSQTVLLSVQ